MAPLLAVDKVTRRFGGVVALDGVTFEVRPGEIVGLIGPNGAGKTTVFNVITRLYTPDSGEIAFDGETLLRTKPRTGDPARDRAHVPEPRALPDDEHPRERARRRAQPRAAATRSSCSTTSASRTWRTVRPPVCRSAR